MIKISHLNKIYKSKKRKHCHALKDINLTLPDAGLIFVLGKSGSGKSTLLNLIGGLDNVTSGSIEVDGNDLAKFREKDFCNYRNTHIGFIFQDYHLIDELTVYENIVLSLNLRRLEDKDDVKNALARVDLAGYEDRYPSELSGGEQQRVAIARAIVKKPRIILADEPTGNLDTNTAKAIVELLKELSRECLILIVSHNVNDANSYADRIIELKKGEIISDVSRNPEFPNEIVLQNDTLVYPDGMALSDGDINLINENLTRKMVKKTDKFLTTNEPKKEAKKVKIENKNLSFSKETLLSGKFLKNKMFAIAASSFMVAAIMVIMALAQTIIAFDGSRIIAGEMAKSNQSSLLLNKIVDEETQKRLPAQYPTVIDENDIQKFYDTGYNGDVYPVLSYTLYTAHIGTVWGLINQRFTGIYLAETFGTMIVDEDFFAKKFGDYKYAARVDKFQNCGIIIPDYVADSIIMLNNKYTGKTYDQLLGEYYFSHFSLAHCYINGIIDTGYKDRYKPLLDKIKDSKNVSASDLYDDPEFQAFLSEIYSSLGYCYTTNPDFVEDYKGTNLGDFPCHYSLVFNDVIEYRTAQYPYVINSTTQKTYLNEESLLGGEWMYTTKAPQIPKGAKYIRVAFNTTVDNVYGLADPVSTAECAVLRFDDGEPISKDIMNAYSGQKIQGVDHGILLGRYDGEITDLLGKGLYSRISEFIEIPDGAEITEFTSITVAGYPYCVFYDENKEFISAVYAPKGAELPSKTVRMNATKYNEIFGTKYKADNLDEFIPHKVKMTHYDYNDVDRKNPLFSTEVTICGLLETTVSRTMDVSQDIYELFAKDSIRVYSLYLDGTDGIGAALDTAEDLNYEAQSFAIEGIHTMTKVVDVFVPIFKIIALFLCAAAVFILMSFSTKMIKSKMHEIGILKALGTKNSTIGAVFGLQVVLIAILTCVLSTVGYYYIVGVANDVLFESMKRFATGNVVLDLEFFTFMPRVALEDCALVGILAMISMLIPMIKIKAIKPVKIIKAKE